MIVSLSLQPLLATFAFILIGFSGPAKASPISISPVVYRLKALLAGAHEISREEVADLNHFWVAQNNALLSRLLKPVPYLACRLAVRPLSKLPPPKNPF